MSLNSLPSYYQLAEEIATALRADQPVVALESTVITHGLPYPENLQLAQNMEKTVRDGHATPATIAVIAGKISIGISSTQLELLAQSKEVRKISSRDLSTTLASGKSGGTTVAATSFIAYRAGIRVFATGGIGGVHRGNSHDISADLIQLSRTPVVVVCAGAKAILDLPATLELLETLSIPVIGYRTDEFPAFYSKSSGLKTSSVAGSAHEVVAIATAHWEVGMQSAVLVTLSPPDEAALIGDSVERAILQAQAEAVKHGVTGQAVTPFLLERVNFLTDGASLQANLALLKNNARLAAEIACQFSS